MLLKKYFWLCCVLYCEQFSIIEESSIIQTKAIVIYGTNIFIRIFWSTANSSLTIHTHGALSLCLISFISFVYVLNINLSKTLFYSIDAAVEYRFLSWHLLKLQNLMYIKHANNSSVFVISGDYGYAQKMNSTLLTMLIWYLEVKGVRTNVFNHDIKTLAFAFLCNNNYGQQDLIFPKMSSLHTYKKPVEQNTSGSEEQGQSLLI